MLENILVKGPIVYDFHKGLGTKTSGIFEIHWERKTKWDTSTPASIAGHNRWWISGSILMISINTFSLILIEVIDPLFKDFLYLIDSIDSRSSKRYLTDGHRSIGTHSIDMSIKPTVKKHSSNFCNFLPWQRKIAKNMIKS
jgi:hypothetical protein